MDDEMPVGTTRRDVLKKGIIAGGLVWAAPVVASGTAWADFVQDNCACNNGFIVYTKYSGKSTNSGATPTMNQCLDPLTGAVGVPVTCLFQLNLITVGTVTNADRQARLNFGASVWLMKTAMKSTNDCYYGFCGQPGYDINGTKNGFRTQFVANGSGQPPHEPGTHLASDPLIFEYNNGACGTIAGQLDGTTACGKIDTVLYDTGSIPGASGGDPLNYIELLLCLPGTSKPPTC